MAGLENHLQEQHDAMQRSIAQCSAYYFTQTGEVAGFDSIQCEPGNRPEVLQAVFDSIGSEHHEKLDEAVRLGISTFQARNGGELPDASVIAAALHAGVSIASRAKQPDVIKAFDSITAMHSEGVSVVPAQTIVTIAAVIANSLPFIALLPNTNNSNQVPLVSVRYVANSDFGAMSKGDYIDGEKAALPYFEGRFEYAMSNTSGTTYGVTARTQYADFEAKTPNTSSAVLPFVSGNVSIRLNGRELAHTRERSKSVTSGVITAIAKEQGVTIGNTTYKLTGSSISVGTGEISVTLNNAIPNGAVLSVHLVADWEAKDPANPKANKLNPCGIDITEEHDSVIAANVRMAITVSIESINQMAYELGLGFVGNVVALMQGKYFLEQNTRVLRDGKKLAELSGWTPKVFDASRGVSGNLSAAFNTTGDLFGEVMKYIDAACMGIKQRSGGLVTTFDLLVGDIGSIFFKQVSGDKVKLTGAVASSYGEIVRLGTTADGKNIYHTPTCQGIITEAPTATEIMIVGRSAEPVRNPFVGHIKTPPTVVSANPVSAFEQEVGVHASMAAEQNPLSRCAEQVGLVQIINLADLGLTA